MCKNKASGWYLPFCTEQLEGMREPLPEAGKTEGAAGWGEKVKTKPKLYCRCVNSRSHVVVLNRQSRSVGL